MSYASAAKSLVALMVMAGASTGVAGEDSHVVKFLTDDARKRVYLLVRGGVELVDAGTRRGLARIELPGWIWAGELYSCPPDIALAPGGDILVTSNVMSVIWRIRRETLAVTVHKLALEQDGDKDIGFTTLRWSAGLGTFVATTDAGATWHVDASLSRARKVSNARARVAGLACGG